MKRSPSLVLLLCLGLLQPVASLQAAPVSPQDIDQLARDYLARHETTVLPPTLTFPEALRIQDAFLRRLEPELGKPVGYKVGLVTREMQQRFGVEAPVRGVLLQKMLLADGAELPALFGVRPILEADLIVVVKDKGINRARSLRDAAEHLSEVVAFIELPDAFLATNPPPSGASLTAANVGARFGVLGQRRAMQSTPAFLHALEAMDVTITDGAGASLGHGQGRVILDHPLNAVLWLVEDLQRAGRRLKAGDLISLGSIKAVPSPAGRTVKVRYEGLPGGPLSVSVTISGAGGAVR